MTRIAPWTAIALLLCLLSAAAAAAQSPTPPDTLLFKDGDKITGEVKRIENDQLVFYASKFSEINIQPSEIADLKTTHTFAVFLKLPKLKEVKRTREVALVGTLEIRGGEVFLRRPGKPDLTLEMDKIDYATDYAYFDSEMSRRIPLYRGWEARAGLGVTFVRSTEDGATLNSEFTATRSMPNINFLPERNKTSIDVTDSYESVSGTDDKDSHETHIFHANAERDEYFSKHFYALGTYDFERNYSQGLLGQDSFDAGLGWTVYKKFSNSLDLKTNYDHRIQDFDDDTLDSVLNGQKFEDDLSFTLPLNMDITQEFDFEASYNKFTDSAGNATAALNIPLYRSLGVALSGTDNFLYDPEPGTHKHSFRFVTSLTYTFQ